jgi:hypothetical protein
MIKNLSLISLMVLIVSCSNDNKHKVLVEGLEKELNETKVLYLDSVDANTELKGKLNQCTLDSENLKGDLHKEKVNQSSLCKSYEDINLKVVGPTVKLENRGKVLKDLGCPNGDIKGLINRVNINARTLNMTLVYKGQNLALRPLDPTGNRVYDRSIVLDNHIIQVQACTDQGCDVICTTLNSTNDHLLEDTYLNLCK